MATRFIGSAAGALVRLLLLAAVVAMLASTASWMTTNIERNRAWVQSYAEARPGAGARPLLESLVKAGFVTYVPARAEFERTTCDEITLLKLKSAAEREPSVREGIKRRIDLLEAFCSTSSGRAIADAIETWNTMFWMLAVRDNRRLEEACAQRSSSVYIPRGCRPGAWTARVKLAPTVTAAAHAAAGVDPPGQLYGFMAIDQTPNYSDWMTVELGDTPELTVHLATKVAPGTPPFLVDVAGEVTGIRIDGREWTGWQGAVARLCHRAREKSNSACPPATAASTLTTLTKDLPKGARVAMPAMPRGAAIEIEVRAVRGLSPQLRYTTRGKEFAGMLPSDAGERLARRRGEELTRLSFSSLLEVHCSPERRLVKTKPRRKARTQPAPPPVTPGKCYLDWRDPGAVKSDQIEVEVAASDGRLLTVTSAARAASSAGGQQAARTPEQTRISDEALKLGLGPVVGLDRRDTGGAIGQIANRGRGVATAGRTRLQLTIDPRLQAIVQSTLDEALADPTPERPGRFAEIQRYFKAQYKSRRRATLLLLDAGADAGAIRAVATWPRVKNDLNEWDMRALADWDQGQSPLAARAWAARDKYATPGSTFKVVTALALIEAAEAGDQTARRIVERLGQADTEKALGVAWNATRVYVPRGSDAPANAPPDPQRKRIKEIANFAKSQTLGGIAAECKGQSCSRALCNLGGQGGGQSLGLCEALMQSSNLFFASAALYLDQDKLAPRDPATGRRIESTFPEPDLKLAKMLRRLIPHPVPDQRCGQLAPPVSLVDLPVQPGSVGAGCYSRVVTDPPWIASTSPREPLRRVSLALNGIGQAAQVPPLDIAVIMASIAKGTLVRPRLTTERLTATDGFEEGKPIITSRQPIPESACDRMDEQTGLTSNDPLLPLRQGLKAVVSAPRGSAARAFGKSDERGPPPSPALAYIRREIAPRVCGKTGTANTQDTPPPAGTGRQRPQENAVSGWFAGWIEPKPTGRITSRLAFVCVITHLSDVGGGSPGASGGRVGGGSTCAPLIARLLARIERDDERF